MEIGVRTSGLLTADAVICDAPCLLWGVVLVGTTTAVSVVLYDHASAASGTVTDKLVSEAGTANTEKAHLRAKGVACTNGLYADVTGTNGAYIVYYEKL